MGSKVVRERINFYITSPSPLPYVTPVHDLNVKRQSQQSSECWAWALHARISLPSTQSSKISSIATSRGMLEQATACLKSVATRRPLPCTREATRSKRLLHSTFWNHGAGDLDLPPWALFILHPLTDQPPLHDNAPSHKTSKRKKRSAESTSQSVATSRGIFLDFLYPPQALAFLQRPRQPKPQLWERRNARRLPEGFILTRGYASRSREQAGVEDQDRIQILQSAEREIEASGETSDVWQEDEGINDESQFMPFGRQSTGSLNEQHAYGDQAQSSDDYSYADSPADLAELGSDAQERVRNIMSSNRGLISGDDLQKSRLVEMAWSLYQSLDEDVREDVQLRRELLLWLCRQDTDAAWSHCAELYESIPTGERTMQVYEAALFAFLGLGQYDQASALHREALDAIENGHQISRTLFRHAVDHGNWELAIQTEAEHHARYVDSNQASQIRVFWLHVSEIPELLARAVQLRKYLGNLDNETADGHTVAFRNRFFKEAISQDFLHPDGSRSMPEWVKRSGPPRVGIRLLFHDIAEDKDAAVFFADFLNAVVRTYSPIDYSRLHYVVSFVYKRYCDMPGAHPSENLLYAFVQQIVHLTDKSHTVRRTKNSLTVADIANEFEKHYGRVSKEALLDLLIFYSRSGQLSDFQHWLEYLRSKFPDYKDQKAMLWTMISVHARRADLDRAQQAFAEVKRLASEHNDEPNLRCWNALLQAHSRVDDLEGGLTNLQNLIDYAPDKPTDHSFHPITQMLAKRGDVEGVVDLLQQYDRLSGRQRTTALLGSLLTANVNNGDVQAAEKVLREAIEGPKEDRPVGSLTGCFNIVLTGYATRRDSNAVISAYKWMQQESIALDANTFAALMQSLVYYRQISAAEDILSRVMPEHNIEPTAFHYGIVMAGHVNTRSYDQALKIHEKMMKRNVRPTISTHTLYLKAKAIKEGDVKGRNPRNEGNPPLDETIKELEQFLVDDDGAEASSGQPGLGIHSPDTPMPTSGAYFDFLIFIHGQRRCFDAVKRLYERYKTKLEESGTTREKTPARMLGTLMYAYLRAFNHTGVEECWKLAKEQADEITARVHVPFLRSRADSDADTDPLKLKHSKTESTTEPKQTLLVDKEAPPSSRPVSRRAHILSRPLRYYLISLNAQSRLSDMITTVSRVLSQGYTLDKPTWNYFIESLCLCSPPLALLAFTLTERYLTPNFPGWSRKTKFPPRGQNIKEKTQYMDIRAIRADVPMPQYPTLVRLGAALLAVRNLEARGSRIDVPPELRKYVGTAKQIRAAAARTVNITQSMPTIQDKMQRTWLRREDR